MNSSTVTYLRENGSTRSDEVAVILSEESTNLFIEDARVEPNMSRPTRKSAAARLIVEFEMLLRSASHLALHFQPSVALR